ncbi:MAG: class I SAM-dependent RNA methyltransferase [Candidatus Muiribacteriota bacterium]
MNINNNDVLKVTVEKIINGGYGLSRKNDFVIFTPYTLPGETVEVKIKQKKKNYAFAEPLQILSPSPWRVKPECEYFTRCGGCDFQHCKYEKQLIFKNEIVHDFFSKFTNNIKHITGANKTYHYRNKVTFHSDGKKTGLYASNSNKIVEINECKIANNLINNNYTVLNNKLNSIKSDLIFKTGNINEIMLVSSSKLEIDSYCKNLFNSVYYRNNHISGKKFIQSHIEALDFYIYPDSFFQVNYEILQKLLNYLKENLRGDNLIDAYCGTGVFDFSLKKNFMNIIGIDIGSHNIKAATKIKNKNNIKNCEFYTGDVKSIIDSFKKADTIIMDPPRKGCSERVLQGILKSGCKEIVYISCNPSTLQRDLKLLTQKYNVKEVASFDMFPQTSHFETVAILNKG